jgi:hypothetical protein
MKRAHWPVLYVILGTLVVVAAAISQLAPDQEVVQRFGPNIATETLGILLTLMFVQRFLERQDRVRRLRSSLGALRRGSRTIRWTTRGSPGAPGWPGSSGRAGKRSVR